MLLPSILNTKSADKKSVFATRGKVNGNWGWRVRNCRRRTRWSRAIRQERCRGLHVREREETGRIRVDLDMSLRDEVAAIEAMVKCFVNGGRVC